MKKTICILSVFALFLSSCTHDDSTPGTMINPNDILVTEINFGPSSEVGSDHVQKFTYNGKKLSKVSFGTSFVLDITYTYTGDLITGEEWTFPAYPDAHREYKYDYDVKERLEKVWAKFGTSGGLVLYKKYTYNDNGSVSENNDIYNRYRYYFNNEGDIIKTDIICTFSDNITKEYIYDNSNSPFKNIIGLNKLNLFYQESLIYRNFHFGNKHNVKSIVTNGYIDYQVEYTYDFLFRFPFKSSYEPDYLDREIKYNIIKKP